MTEIERYSELDGIDLDSESQCGICGKDATRPEGLCKDCDRKLEIDKETEGSL